MSQSIGSKSKSKSGSKSESKSGPKSESRSKSGSKCSSNDRRHVLYSEWSEWEWSPTYEQEWRQRQKPNGDWEFEYRTKQETIPRFDPAPERRSLPTRPDGDDPITSSENYTTVPADSLLRRVEDRDQTVTPTPLSSKRLSTPLTLPNAASDFQGQHASPPGQYPLLSSQGSQPEWNTSGPQQLQWSWNTSTWFPKQSGSLSGQSRPYGSPLGPAGPAGYSNQYANIPALSGLSGYYGATAYGYSQLYEHGMKSGQTGDSGFHRPRDAAEWSQSANPQIQGPYAAPAHQELTPGFQANLPPGPQPTFQASPFPSARADAHPANTTARREFIYSPGLPLDPNSPKFWSEEAVSKDEAVVGDAITTSSTNQLYRRSSGRPTPGRQTPEEEDLEKDDKPTQEEDDVGDLSRTTANFRLHDLSSQGNLVVSAGTSYGPVPPPSCQDFGGGNPEQHSKPGAGQGLRGGAVSGRERRASHSTLDGFSNERRSQQQQHRHSRHSTSKGASKNSKNSEPSQQPLYPSFKTHNSKAFKKGMVFKCLWSEPFSFAPPKSPSDIASQPSKVETIYIEDAGHSQKAYSSIRRFVIVKENKGHCLCVPILTYQMQGTNKPGVKAEHHTIIYTGETPPNPLPGEIGPYKRPVRMNPLTSRDELFPESRLNYSKLYTVEHNIRILGQHLRMEDKMSTMAWR